MQNIDIVIAWVDGNDIELKKKRHKYLTGEDASDAISDTRFASNNEIYYNVASILKYVPFYRNILIVTDNQRPAFIDEFAAQGLCSRSEEHTSELQSRENLVCRLLLEKKKKRKRHREQ